uniref:GNAS complex locus n=1 Tax=Anas platyrhynchos platyrhynchos TaxID=8840 RepID=A0A493T0I1_ANAPP
MGCLGNSKTEDQRIDEKAQREANKKIEKQLQKERLAYKATHRLLLLGKAAGTGARGGGGGGGRRRRPGSKIPISLRRFLFAPGPRLAPVKWSLAAL